MPCTLIVTLPLLARLAFVALALALAAGWALLARTFLPPDWRM